MMKKTFAVLNVHCILVKHPLNANRKLEQKVVVTFFLILHLYYRVKGKAESTEQTIISNEQIVKKSKHAESL